MQPLEGSIQPVKFQEVDLEKRIVLGDLVAGRLRPVRIVCVIEAADPLGPRMVPELIANRRSPEQVGLVLGSFIQLQQPCGYEGIAQRAVLR